MLYLHCYISPPEVGMHTFPSPCCHWHMYFSFSTPVCTPQVSCCHPGPRVSFYSPCVFGGFLSREMADKIKSETIASFHIYFSHTLFRMEPSPRDLFLNVCTVEFREVYDFICFAIFKLFFWYTI
jgi:hypothetical protein